jgi:hypothetical protein
MTKKTPPENNPPAPAQQDPKRSKRVFNPNDAGFSLLADEETLLEIESVHDEAVKASHGALRFAWR